MITTLAISEDNTNTKTANWEDELEQLHWEDENGFFFLCLSLLLPMDTHKFVNMESNSLPPLDIKGCLP